MANKFVFDGCWQERGLRELYRAGRLYMMEIHITWPTTESEKRYRAAQVWAQEALLHYDIDTGGFPGEHETEDEYVGRVLGVIGQRMARLEAGRRAGGCSDMDCPARDPRGEPASNSLAGYAALVDYVRRTAPNPPEPVTDAGGRIWCPRCGQKKYDPDESYDWRDEAVGDESRIGRPNFSIDDLPGHKG